MPKVTFQPDDVTVEVNSGTSIFAAAIEADVEIESQCGGRGGCALCRVKLPGGDASVTPMEWDERNHLGNVFHVTQERLACQTRILGDLTVEILEPVERAKQPYVPHKYQRNAKAALQARLESEQSEQDAVRTVKGRRRQGRRSRDGGPDSGTLEAAPPPTSSPRQGPPSKASGGGSPGGGDRGGNRGGAPGRGKPADEDKEGTEGQRPRRRRRARRRRGRGQGPKGQQGQQGSS